MPLPDTLSGRAYLALYDRDRGRLTSRGFRTQLLAGAALADLYLGGHVVDEGGRVATAGRNQPTEPVQAELWRRIDESRPRRWQHWAAQRGLEAVIRDELSTRWIRIDRPPRFLRRARVSLRDPRAHTQLRTVIDGTLRGPMPIGRMPEQDTMLVALLAVAEVRPLITRQRKREYKRRIDEAIARGGAPIDGVRRAVRQARQAQTGGG